MQHKLIELGKKLLPKDAYAKLDLAQQIHVLFTRIKPAHANLSANDVLEKYFITLYPSLLAAEQDTTWCAYNTRMVLSAKLHSYADVTPANLESLLKINQAIEASNAPREKINMYSVLMEYFCAPIHDISTFTNIMEHNPESDHFFTELPLIIKNVFRALIIYIRSRDILEKQPQQTTPEANYYQHQPLFIASSLFLALEKINSKSFHAKVKGYDRPSSETALLKIITQENLDVLAQAKTAALKEHNMNLYTEIKNLHECLNIICNRAVAYALEKTKNPEIRPTITNSIYLDQENEEKLADAILDVYTSIRGLIPK